MAHRIKSINIKTNYVIEALFFGGELKQYDIKGLFKILPDFQIFLTCRWIRNGFADRFHY